MSEPQRLSVALSQLIALRGLARRGADAQLQQSWQAVLQEVLGVEAGSAAARVTRAASIRRGVLQVFAGHAPLLSELVNYHRGNLVLALQQKFPDLKVRDIKFKLDGELMHRQKAN